MGLLDDLLASVAGAGAPPPREPQARAGAGGMGGMGNVMMALLPVVLAMMSQRRGGAPQAGASADTGLGGLGGLLGSLLGSSGGAGGLGDLLSGFERAGFGSQAQSWVGRGANEPLPADGIEKVFGPGGLAEIARQAGLSQADASRGLSQLLPEVVDRLTPEGQLPQADALLASVQSLARNFGGR